MSGELVPIPTPTETAGRHQLPATLQDLAEKAADYASKARAANTRRAYEADWRAFEDWCRDQNLAAMPAAPGTVMVYLTAHAGALKVSTLSRRPSAIHAAHDHAGAPLDLASSRGLHEVWKGIKNTHGTAKAKKTALLTTELRAAIDALPQDTLIGLRDRALLLVGFSAALRRSELVALHLGEGLGLSTIEATADGLVLFLARAKTDQQAEGTKLGVPYGTNPDTCPVRAFLRWREAAGLREGPVFRLIDRHGNIGSAALTDHTAAKIVKRTIKAGDW